MRIQPTVRAALAVLLLAAAALSACSDAPTARTAQSITLSIDSASYSAGSAVTVTATNVGAEPATPYVCPYGVFEMKAAGTWFRVGDTWAGDCTLDRAIAPGALLAFRAVIPANASSGLYRYNFRSTGLVTGEFVVRGR
jgi:hypothetical protein